ncbi:MAG: glycosyltransferase family 2 protein [Candidatus Marinimicrobia bacterium]|nr:glycosyltransferase family 2 protein [Candidatus Neomarinimicrobiota bacterium]
MYISIIIPHWNGIDILSECLDSIKQSSFSEKEIIVVDNASTDGSQDWIKDNHSDIILVENDQNYGYAGGCNRGVNNASGEWLLFLNNDTIQETDWLDHLAKAVEGKDDVAAVQPKIRNYYERKLFDYAGGAGGHLDLLCYPFAKGRIFLEQEEDNGQYDKSSDIFWASGTAIMVRKGPFIEAGGFDETYFAHQEEIDLCWRLHLMDTRVIFEPNAIVYHKNAVSLPMHSFQKYYLNHRNSFFMMLTNYNLPLTLYLLPVRFALEWVTIGYALVKWDLKHIGAVLKSLGWLLTHPHTIYKKRQLVKKLRRKNDREMLKQFYRGSIVYAHYIRGIKKYTDL